MAKNTMPERITVHRINNDKTFPNNVCVTDLKPGALLPDDIEEQEYVRADLTAGDVNEPLAEGQFRWVSVGGERHVALVIEVGEFCGRDDAFYRTTSGLVYSGIELDFIGPVIHPPEGA